MGVVVGGGVEQGWVVRAAGQMWSGAGLLNATRQEGCSSQAACQHPEAGAGRQGAAAGVPASRLVCACRRRRASSSCAGAPQAPPSAAPPRSQGLWHPQIVDSGRCTGAGQGPQGGREGRLTRIPAIQAACCGQRRQQAQGACAMACTPLAWAGIRCTMQAAARVTPCSEACPRPGRAAPRRGRSAPAWGAPEGHFKMLAGASLHCLH